MLGFTTQYLMIPCTLIIISRVKISVNMYPVMVRNSRSTLWGGIDGLSIARVMQFKPMKQRIPAIVVMWLSCNNSLKIWTLSYIFLGCWINYCNRKWYSLTIVEPFLLHQILTFGPYATFRSKQVQWPVRSCVNETISKTSSPRSVALSLSFPLFFRQSSLSFNSTRHINSSHSRISQNQAISLILNCALLPGVLGWLWESCLWHKLPTARVCHAHGNRDWKTPVDHHPNCSDDLGKVPAE